MNKLLKFQTTKEQNMWFLSDLHWHHNKDFIYKARGFESIEQHDEAVIKSINDNVKHNDILFFLGDLCLNTSESQFEELLTLINCQTIYYIWGNHNSRVKDVYLKALKSNFPTTDIYKTLYDFSEVEVYPVKYRNLTFLGNYQEIVVNGHYIILSHYPMRSWNGMNKGAFHLFGHIHSHNEFISGKSLDVGFDAFKKPLSFSEICDMMIKMSIVHEGHH